MFWYNFEYNRIINPKFDFKNKKTLGQDKNARQWVGEGGNINF